MNVGGWSLYFLVKAGLFYAALTGFQWAWNFLLLLVVAWPLQARWSRSLRLAVAVPAAMALAYHESFLPKATRVLSQLDALRGFSPAYMGELIARFLTPSLLAAAAAILVTYWLLRRRIRLGSFALLAILSVPLVSALSARPTTFQAHGPSAVNAVGNADAPGTSAVVGNGGPDARLRSFFVEEASRKVEVPNSGNPPAFDILVLHICSLSWDDLAFVGRSDPALLKRFDVLFRNFNSAASYSGPSSIRVLQGNCGQPAHKALYEASRPECYVFPTLEQAGFKTAGLLNHTGTFDNFTQALEQRGLRGKMADHTAAAVSMQAFDGSAVYDDYSVLSQWWKQQAAASTNRIALYYNTITLHDGNRAAWLDKPSSMGNYKQRLDKLLADLDRFISEVESSGRPVVLVLVPEHGAALRGDRMQPAGLREIPGPQITLVPAAVKLIGLSPSTNRSPLIVDQPMSYLEVNMLLADFLADNPFAASGRPLAARVAALPTTAFVSENDDVVVMGNGAGSYQVRTSDGIWVPYQAP